MGIAEFFHNPMRATVLSAIEFAFNNADNAALLKLLEFAGNDEKTIRLIKKLKRVIQKLQIDISDEEGAVKLAVDVAGAGTVNITIYISKLTTNDSVVYVVKSVETSAEWLTILADEIVLGELLEEKDKTIGVTGFPGTLLSYII